MVYQYRREDDEGNREEITTQFSIPQCLQAAGGNYLQSGEGSRLIEKVNAEDF